jgi:hypothetical protein
MDGSAQPAVEQKAPLRPFLLSSCDSARTDLLAHRIVRPQLHVGGKKARLGPQSRLPGLIIGFLGSIQWTPAVVRHLPAYRRCSPLQPFGYLANRRTGSNPS